jgi:agmatine deiminase
LRNNLGAQKIVWLPRGELAGDDTDGHIDQLARFVSANTVVVAVANHPQDENRDPLQQNYEYLRDSTNQDGDLLHLVSLPLPTPKWFAGRRLPASYCNFYLANQLLVVPQFDDPADELALRILSDLFPARALRGLPALDLVWGLGSFHCVTMQEPAACGAETASE